MKKVEFKNLHKKRSPLVLLNCWDQESSEILTKNDINVIATSSYAVAAVLGFQDGENMTFKQLLAILKTLHGEAVSIDLESGYGTTEKELQANLNALVDDTIVGINIEDRYPNTKKLIEAGDQSKKLKEITKSEAGQQLFINARTDTFFLGNSWGNNQDRKILNQTIERGKLYEAAGCDGFFVPGLKNKEFIQELSEAINIPLNIMLDIQNDDINDYLDIGVSRISFGPSLYIEWKNSKQTKNDYLVSKIAQLEQFDHLINLKK